MKLYVDISTGGIKASPGGGNIPQLTFFLRDMLLFEIVFLDGRVVVTEDILDGNAIMKIGLKSFPKNKLLAFSGEYTLSGGVALVDFSLNTTELVTFFDRDVPTSAAESKFFFEIQVSDALEETSRRVYTQQPAVVRRSLNSPEDNAPSPVDAIMYVQKQALFDADGQASTPVFPAVRDLDDVDDLADIITHGHATPWKVDLVLDDEAVSYVLRERDGEAPDGVNYILPGDYDVGLNNLIWARLKVDPLPLGGKADKVDGKVPLSQLPAAGTVYEDPTVTPVPGIVRLGGVLDAGGQVPTNDRLGNFVSGWWMSPLATFDPLSHRLYLGGIGRGGDQKVGYVDLRTGLSESVTLSVTTTIPDDHNSIALHVVDGKVPICLYRKDGNTQKMYVRRGIAPLNVLDWEPEQELDMGIFCGYGHIIARPGTNDVALLIFGNPGGSPAFGWYLFRSADWGATWSGPLRCFVKNYALVKHLGDQVIVGCSTHPQTTANAEVNWFRIELSTGNIYSQAGALHTENFWTSSNNPVIAGSFIATAMTINHNAVDPTLNKIRLFDATLSTAGPMILVGYLTYPAPEDGCLYRVRLRMPGGTWSIEELGNSGPPFGYDVSHYYAGAVFDGTGFTVYLIRCRVEGGVRLFTVEMWTRDHQGTTAATWTKVKDIEHSRSPNKLARILNPVSFAGETLNEMVYSPNGFVVMNEYVRYLTNSFNDYYGDRKVTLLNPPA